MTYKVGPAERFATIGNLLSGTSYKFRVQASNADAPGPLSDTVTASTNLSPVYPGVIENVNFKINDRNVIITWMPPSGLVFACIAAFNVYF